MFEGDGWNTEDPVIKPGEEECFDKGDKSKNKEEEMMLAYKTIDFGYKSEELWALNTFKRISGEYNEDSLERTLLENLQVQTFLTKIVLDQDSRRAKALERNKKIWREKYKSEVPPEEKMSLSEYALLNSDTDEYIKFLSSEEGVNVAEDKINELMESGKIDEETLKTEIRTEWLHNINKKYYEKYYTQEQIEIFDSIFYGVKKTLGTYLENFSDNENNGDNWKRLINELNKLVSSINESGDSGIDKNDIIDFIRQNIRNLSTRVLEKNEKNKKTKSLQLDTGNDHLDRENRCYLILYCELTNPGDFDKYGEVSEYETKLSKTLGNLLHIDKKSSEYKNDDLQNLINEENRREQERMQHIEEKIRKKNERLNAAPRRTNGAPELQEKSFNPNDATGAEIAEEAKLDLSSYDLEIDESDEITLKKNDDAFHIAWGKFINSSEGSEFKGIFTEEDMHLLFDIKTGTFRNRHEDINIQNPLLQKMDEAERKKIYDKLTKFLIYFDKTKDHLFDTFSKIKEVGNKKVKIHAVGTVIDNVKDSFSKIAEKQFGNSQEFKLDTTPISQDGDDIIISGTLNGSNLVLRYNLRSGYLLMNSLFQKIENVDKYQIGGDVWTPIGLIGKFDDILGKYQENFQRGKKNTKEDQHVKDINQGGHHEHENHGDGVAHEGAGHPSQKIPMDNRESKKEEFKNILNRKRNLINENIENELRNRAMKNVTITNFMKTFNIIPDSGGKILVFEKDSTNLFNIIQIIDNTGNIGNPESLKYFNNEFMPKIMQYSGLKWGKNNLNGPEKNTGNQQEYETTFNNNSKNENVLKIRKSAEDFKGKIISQKNYGGNYQLEFINFITDNFKDGDEPNWKLNLSSMQEFLMSLDKDAIDEEFEGKLKEAYI